MLPCLSVVVPTVCEPRECRSARCQFFEKQSRGDGFLASAFARLRNCPGRRMAREKIEQTFARLRAKMGGARPNRLRISKKVIASVLGLLDKSNPDIVDAVYALLDDTL